MNNPLILEKGVWQPWQVLITQNTEPVKLKPQDLAMIEQCWKKILQINPTMVARPTISLVSHCRNANGNLLLEVKPSNYKEGCIIGFLGVAMVPITSDGFMALQAPVASISEVVGHGIRVPGCTPSHIDLVPQIITEMKEEFNVKIAQDNLIILGLTEVRPPLAKYHHGLVAKIHLNYTKDELEQAWQNAQDKWEGKLLFLKLDYKKKILLSPWDNKSFNQHSLLIIKVVADYEFSGARC